LVIPGGGIFNASFFALPLYAGAHSLGYTYRKAGPGEWRSDLDATEALTGMIDTTTRTVTMTRRRRANQPGVLVQRALFFSTTSTRRAGSRSTTGNRTWASGAVVAIRGCGPGRPTAGERFDRRRWDNAVGVRADYQGPSEELTRTITVAETKHNPLPPTLS